MLPHKLKNFRVFNEGDSYAGIAKTITPPKLAIQAEAYRGAGMLAEVDADLGLQKLEMDSSYGGFVVGILRQFGLMQVDGAMLRFVGAYQADDTGQVQAAELVVRGRHVELDMGDAEAGKDTEWKVKSSLSYLKWTVNGSVEVEIDVLNMIYSVGGVDRMKEIRDALGG